MKKKLLLILIPIILGGILYINFPKEIRNDYLKEGISEEKIKKGKALLVKMEDAHGGKDNWTNYDIGEFTQKAVWYGKLKLSHWDTLPQLFEMVSQLGSYDCSMTLLNGKNKGKEFRLADDQLWELDVLGKWAESDEDRFHEKMIFKTYWFQFPFRIGEASIISYAGEEVINGNTYDLLFATWGEEKANRKFDQFMLYLDRKTHLLKYLHFTVRDKIKAMELTTEYQNYKQIGELYLPHSQYVRLGKPNEDGLKMHENHYEEIKFSNKKNR